MQRLLMMCVMALVGLVLPGALSAQSGAQAKRVSMSRAATVWSQAPVYGPDRRSDDRDSDSDSDSDSDLDSDSDSEDRAGGVFGRRGGDRDTAGRTLEDIILGPRDREAPRERRDRDGGILKRLPLPGDGRDLPRTPGTARIDELGRVLDRLLGGG